MSATELGERAVHILNREQGAPSQRDLARAQILALLEIANQLNRIRILQGGMA